MYQNISLAEYYFIIIIALFTRGKRRRKKYMSDTLFLDVFSCSYFLLRPRFVCFISSLAPVQLKGGLRKVEEDADGWNTCFHHFPGGWIPPDSLLGILS
jgi:hypothetical protein